MSKIAMVTGAGTGVGRRVSEVLSKDGIIVYLIGRRKDKLKKLKNYALVQLKFYNVMLVIHLRLKMHLKF